MVLLSDGSAQLVDLVIVDVLRLDLREAPPSEREVALQDAFVVFDRTRLVLLLTDGEEEVYHFVPGYGVRLRRRHWHLPTPQLHGRDASGGHAVGEAPHRPRQRRRTDAAGG